MSKVEEASSIFRVDFSLSKCPHFHRAYLVKVPFLNSIAVQGDTAKMGQTSRLVQLDFRINVVGVLVLPD